MKILGVVFGALFLLTGVVMFAAANNTSGRGADPQMAERGLTGPFEGRVTAIEGPTYSVEYTDLQGATRTGRGAVAEGTTPPEQGDDVQVYANTADPTQIIILDFPGGSFTGVAGLLRIIGIVCLAVGAVLLLAGGLGLVTGRRRGSAAGADQPGYAPPAAVQAGQQPGPSAPTQAPPPDGPRGSAPRPASTPTEPPAPHLGRAGDPGLPPDPTPPAGQDRPGN